MLLTDFPVPNVGIHHKEDNTQTFIDGKMLGTGSVYVAERYCTVCSSAHDTCTLLATNVAI